MIALNDWFKSKGEDPFKDADLSKVRFPSDTITIRQFRELNREAFDDNTYDVCSEFDKFCHREIYALITAERLLALEAYGVAKGVGEILEEYKPLCEDLERLYVRYGLAKGPHEARELIRDFEQQARALAGERQK